MEWVGRAQLPSLFAAKILDSHQYPARGDGAPCRQGDIAAAGGGVSPLRVREVLPRNIRLRFCTYMFLV